MQWITNNNITNEKSEWMQGANFKWNHSFDIAYISLFYEQQQQQIAEWKEVCSWN